MKKALAPIITFGLAALFATATISCNQGAKSTSTLAGDSLMNAKEDGQIVYVNADSLFAKYELFKDVQVKLETKAKKAQDDLQARSIAFQREVAEYQQKAQMMSAADRQSTEERLARKQDELARYQQNASASFAQDEATENEALYKKITEYLKEHAKENGYKFVLTYSAGNPYVLYADPSQEITDKVIKALNEAYAKEKNK